jgi:hypothetical protein
LKYIKRTGLGLVAVGYTTDNKDLTGVGLVITEDSIIKVMELKFEHKNKNFSFIECVVFILSKENDMKFLTGEKEFESAENVEFVKIMMEPKFYCFGIDHPRI